MARFINDSIAVFYYDTSIAEKACVFISDATPYIVKTVREALKMFYPNLIYVTCFAHAVHRFIVENRSEF